MMRSVVLGLSCLCGGSLAFSASADARPLNALRSHSAGAMATVNRPAAQPAVQLHQMLRRSDQKINMLSADKPLKIGVVGVTGAVGVEIIDVLGKRGFPVAELKLFASARSAGKDMKTPFGDLKIQEFSLEAARDCDVVFLAVSGDFAEEWAEKIAENDGALVIDNSSAFRYKEDTPLCVPEINADAARKSKKNIIANPNCTTAIALMALAPLHNEFGIKRCIMSTYQAASGAGAPGMKELEDGAAQFVKGEKVENSVFAHQAR